MENATKALLIAAAVLVAILIISLGLVVYNMASETVNNSANLSEYEIQSFNEKFTKYAVDNKSGSDVNAMLKTVFNHNLAQGESSTQVKVTGDANLDKSATSYEKVPTGSRYDVVVNVDPNSKMVNSITVTKVGSSSGSGSGSGSGS